MTQEGLLRSRDVAELLNCSVRQVQDMAKKGEMPAVRLSGEWRFDRSKIDLWLKGEQPQQSTES